MKIRKPNLENIGSSGVPTDFEKSSGLFNRLLKEGKLRGIPRTEPVTMDEVRNLWVPSANKNITYLAETPEGEIVSSGTLLIKQGSNIYNQQTKEKNEYSLIFDPEYTSAAVYVTGSVISKALEKNKDFYIHTLPERKKIVEDVLERTGFAFNRKPLENYNPFKELGFKGDCWEYSIS